MVAQSAKVTTSTNETKENKVMIRLQEVQADIKALEEQIARLNKLEAEIEALEDKVRSLGVEIEQEIASK